MSAFAKNLRHAFSDLWLEIDLFFGRFTHHKQKIVVPPTPVEPVAPEPAIPATPSVPTATTSISPVVPPVTPATPKASPIITPQVAEKTKVTGKVGKGLKFVNFSNRERLFFYDQMATLIGSGVTLIDSLLIMQAQTKNKTIKRLYDQMIHHINGGMSLAESMAVFPRAFPPMQSALVEAAEKSGNLNEVMSQIVEDLEGHQDFMRKIKGAMFYPVILVVLALSMVAGMMIFVIPKVAELYEQSNATLPALTQIVIDISDVLSTYYLFIFGGSFAFVVILLILINKTIFGKLIWEKFVSSIPVFGRISKEQNIMAFAANLGMLLQSGVLITEAFEISERTIENLHYRRAIAEIRHGIVLGRSVSEMMGLEDIKAQKFKEHKLFPLQVAQMIHIGELTGTIAKMLVKIRQNYHKSIDYTLKNISTMIEPIMIFIVAILVGSILLAVMLPFFYIGTTIS